MKKLVFILLSCIGQVGLIHGQEVARELVSAAGEQLRANDNTSIRFTAGEVVVGLVSNGPNLHQGFIQSEADLVSSTFDPKILSQFSVFPNPVSDQLTVKSDEISSYSWALISLSGQIMANGKSEDKINRINTKALVPSHYLLRIDGDDGSALFKIVKIDENHR